MAEVIDLGDQQVPVEPVVPGFYASGAGSLSSDDGRRIAGSNDRQDVAALSRSANGRTAAALAAGQLLQSLIDHPTSPRAAENAEMIISDLRAQLDAGQEARALVAAEPQPVTQTDSGLHVVQQPEEPAQMPTDYELPAEYAFLNDEDDEPAQVDDDLDLTPDPVAAAPVQPDALELDEDDMLDPRIAALVAERDKLAKKAAHEQQLRVKTTRPTWEDEAKRVFRLGDVPLLDDQDFASIRADSKREFLRQAKQIADRNKRVIVRVAPTQRSEADIRREAKAEVWGAPPASAPPGDADQVDRDQRIAKARRTGRLANIYKEMIR